MTTRVHPRRKKTAPTSPSPLSTWQSERSPRQQPTQQQKQQQQEVHMHTSSKKSSGKKETPAVSATGCVDSEPSTTAGAQLRHSRRKKLTRSLSIGVLGRSPKATKKAQRGGTASHCSEEINEPPNGRASQQRETKSASHQGVEHHGTSMTPTQAPVTDTGSKEEARPLDSLPADSTRAMVLLQKKTPPLRRGRAPPSKAFAANSLTIDTRHANADDPFVWCTADSSTEPARTTQEAHQPQQYTSTSIGNKQSRRGRHGRADPSVKLSPGQLLQAHGDVRLRSRNSSPSSSPAKRSFAHAHGRSRSNSYNAAEAPRHHHCSHSHHDDCHAHHHPAHEAFQVSVHADMAANAHFFPATTADEKGRRDALPKAVCAAKTAPLGAGARGTRKSVAAGMYHRLPSHQHTPNSSSHGSSVMDDEFSRSSAKKGFRHHQCTASNDHSNDHSSHSSLHKQRQSAPALNLFLARVLRHRKACFIAAVAIVFLFFVFGYLLVSTLRTPCQTASITSSGHKGGKLRPPVVEYYIHGHGHGHASRARTVIKELKHQGFYVCALVGENVASLVKDVADEVVFVDILRRGDTAQNVWSTLVRLLRHRDCSLCHQDHFAPDLIITDGDFPGALRASLANIPSIALGHGYIFSTSQYEDRLPPASWEKEALLNSRVTNLATCVVGVSFVPFTPIENATTIVVKPRLRSVVLAASLPLEPRKLVTVYFRDPDLATRVIEALAVTEYEVHVFGADFDTEGYANVHMRPFDDVEFVRSLAEASAVVATSGDNLIAECMYFGVPMLAMYRGSDAEQELNAQTYAVFTNMGMASSFEDFTPELLNTFLAGLSDFRAQPNALKLWDGPDVIDGALKCAVKISPHVALWYEARQARAVKRRGPFSQSSVHAEEAASDVGVGAPSGEAGARVDGSSKNIVI